MNIDDLTTAVATHDEMDALIKLLGHLFEQECEFTPAPELQRAGVAQIIDDSDKGEILIIKDQQQVVGMVTLLYTISTALGGKVALLEDMVVDPAFRGQGIGTRLIQDAISHAGKCDCLRITLLTDQANSDAQRFYSDNGFHPSSMTPFRLLLGDEK